MLPRFKYIVIVLVLACTSQAATGGEDDSWQTRTVTATAYNDTAAQTQKKHIGITAWGERLKPGMKALAVSRDLIKQGLDYGTRVKIEGLRGIYVVRDKMHARWQNKIDIFMGKDTAESRAWGAKKVIIHWLPPED